MGTTNSTTADTMLIGELKAAIRHAIGLMGWRKCLELAIALEAIAGEIRQQVAKD